MTVSDRASNSQGLVRSLLLPAWMGLASCGQPSDPAGAGDTRHADGATTGEIPDAGANGPADAIDPSLPETDHTPANEQGSTGGSSNVSIPIVAAGEPDASPGSAGTDVGDAAGGAAETANGGADSGAGTSVADLPRFSFFVTSQARLFSLASAFNGSVDGFGGDLTYGETGPGAGLKGADRICSEIAEATMPGASAKQWRAFLSVSAGPDGTPVNAIDRIGTGPWYDRLGRLVANTVSDLQATRPVGADAAIVDDLPNEDGEPNHRPGGIEVDNHNVLTGSDASGRLATSAEYSPTCQDWTDATTGSSAANVGPCIGNSWWGGTGVGTEYRGWIYCGHNAAGCQPGAVDLNADLGFGVGQGGVNCGTVGCMGGYGAIYCFALVP